VTSAGNQKDAQEASFVLTDTIARRDCARISTQREPIAHWTKASSRRCLVIHARPQKFWTSGIRKPAALLSNYADQRRRLHERSHGKDIYESLVVNVFVDEQNVAELLSREDHSTRQRSKTPIHHLQRGQPCQFNFIFEMEILIGI
jgi:hypothetical protein